MHNTHAHSTLIHLPINNCDHSLLAPHHSTHNHYSSLNNYTLIPHHSTLTYTHYSPLNTQSLLIIQHAHNHHSSLNTHTLIAPHSTLSHNSFLIPQHSTQPSGLTLLREESPKPLLLKGIKVLVGVQGKDQGRICHCFLQRPSGDRGSWLDNSTWVNRHENWPGKIYPFVCIDGSYCMQCQSTCAEILICIQVH